ncbi:MAG: hypothetical protein ACI9U0_002517 [Flavobacteriales bacterium]|jgi:hypothetical protein|tara:strand:+ start:301 stop:1050 length:750 start_codon:yes stop_codon:yes gene_type:complete
MSEEMISKINEVITNYFNTNKDTEWIPIKTIMADLVLEGVFVKDVKKGMPFRKVLTTLHFAKELSKIPSVHAEKKEEAIYWYLVREGGKFTPKESSNLPAQNPNKKVHILNSDDTYLIELCDQLLKEVSRKQFTFDDLLGDFHKDKISQTKLPLDAYYTSLNLVIEVVNKKSTPPKKGKDKSQKLTVSGVTREEQRKVYQERKSAYLAENNIKLFEINFALFETNDQNKLVRTKDNDEALLKELLKSVL